MKEFNIGFGYPRTDTCSSCDFSKHSIETASDDNEKAGLEKDLKQHHILAQSGYLCIQKSSREVQAILKKGKLILSTLPLLINQESTFI